MAGERQTVVGICEGHPRVADSAVRHIHQVTILSSCKMASMLPDFPLAQSLLASCGFSQVK